MDNNNNNRANTKNIKCCLEEFSGIDNNIVFINIEDFPYLHLIKEIIENENDVDLKIIKKITIKTQPNHILLMHMF